MIVASNVFHFSKKYFANCPLRKTLTNLTVQTKIKQHEEEKKCPEL